MGSEMYSSLDHCPYCFFEIRSYDEHRKGCDFTSLPYQYKTRVEKIVDFPFKILAAQQKEKNIPHLRLVR